jgi:hypothetical protein
MFGMTLNLILVVVAGDCGELVGGGDRGAEGDVQDDGHRQQRADQLRGAQGWTSEGRRQHEGVGDLSAHAGCKFVLLSSFSHVWESNNSCSNVFLVFSQADIDNSGTIDYGEFIAATLHLNKVEKEDHLFAAFQYFDKDGSGYITADELQQACDEFGIEDVRLEDMIGEVDQDNVL